VDSGSGESFQIGKSLNGHVNIWRCCQIRVLIGKLVWEARKYGNETFYISYEKAFNKTQFGWLEM
jgi:hypothetical protein